MAVLNLDRWPAHVEKLRDTNKIYLGLAVVFVYTLVKYFRNLWLSPLRNVPGPKLYAFSSFPITYKGLIGQRTLAIHALHEKYGPTIRIGPNEVSFADYETFHKIYAQGTNFLKTTYYSVISINPDAPALFALSDKSAHAKRRRLLSHAFARTSILALEDFTVSEARMLMNQFNRMSVEKQKSNLFLWFRFFTADVIIQGAFGIQANMVKTGEIHQFLRDMDATVFMWFMMDMFGPLYEVGKYVSTYFPKTTFRQYYKAIDYGLAPYARKCVKDYLASWDKTSERKDIISKMLTSKDPETGTYMDFETMSSDAGNLIVAGTDTTSTTLTYFAWEILNNPEAKHRLHAELDQAIPDVNHFLTYQQLEKLPYLKACIKETLRVHAAAPSTMPRVVPKSGLQTNGHYIPPNTVVGSQVYSLHRSTDIFGPDADSWIPERWLKEDVYRMEKALVPFSQGPQNCLGLNLAYLELHIAAAYFARCFDGERAEGFPADGMDHIHFFLTVPKAHACVVNLRPRADLRAFAL